MAKYDNSGRLEAVGEKDWREALDELTAYLRWRLRGKTQWGAHSERVLEIPALDYYTEEAVAKLIEGDTLRIATETEHYHGHDVQKFKVKSEEVRVIRNTVYVERRDSVAISTVSSKPDSLNPKP